MNDGPSGAHTMLLDDFQVLAGAGPRPSAIDAFDRGFLEWITPGGREVFHANLKLSDFEGPGKLDPSLLKSMALTDITGAAGGAAAPNTIWIGKVEAPADLPRGEGRRIALPT